MKTLKKNSKGYNYKYTDIAGIHEYLESEKISYYQYVETVEGNDYIMTVPIIENKELPARRGCRVVQGTLQGVSNPAQEQGSAITYARRYSLLLAFGLATEDDDGKSLDRPKIREGVQGATRGVERTERSKVSSDIVGVGKATERQLTAIGNMLQHKLIDKDQFFATKKLKESELTVSQASEIIKELGEIN